MVHFTDFMQVSRLHFSLNIEAGRLFHCITVLDGSHAKNTLRIYEADICQKG